MRRILVAVAVAFLPFAVTAPAHSEPLAATVVAPPHSVQWKLPTPRLDQGERDTCVDFASMQQLNMLPGRKISQAIADRISDLAEATATSATYSAQDTLRDALAHYGYRTTYRELSGVTAALAALQHGPVTLEVPFTEGMYSTDGNGRWRATGDFAFLGHGVVLTGVDYKHGRVALLQEWSTWWGVDGTMWMTIADLRALFAAYPQFSDVDVWARA